MQKGTMAESDGMDLIKEVTGKVYFKNQKQIENAFVCGTPDIDDKEAQAIRDMKLSWDIWTFAKVDVESAKKDYYWQILSYADMKGYKKGSLIYGLVTTPDMLVNDEILRLSYKMPDEQADAFRKNYIYDDIPAKDRLKQFDFEFPDEDFVTMHTQVELCREFLKGMHL
jgi:hypothetical protein